MKNLCKITLLTFVFLTFSVFGQDLSSLKGKWVGTTQLSDIDHVAFLQIEDDSSGYYTQTILSSGVTSKYKFTIDEFLPSLPHAQQKIRRLPHRRGHDT